MKNFDLIITLIALIVVLVGCEPSNIMLKVTSEPSRAKLFEDGRHIGTTPCYLRYVIPKHLRQGGTFDCSPFVCIKQGYVPQEYEFQVNIPADYGFNEIYLRKGFLLERTSHQGNEYNINIRNEESPIDTGLKVGSFINMLKNSK